MAQAKADATATAAARRAEATARRAEATATAEAREAEARALRERIEREQATIRSDIETALVVTLLAKGFREADFLRGRIRDAITIRLGLENRGERDVTGVRGVLRFFDVLGEEVQSVRWTYDRTLGAGQSATWNGEIEYNQFLQKDRRFRQLGLDRLRFVFDPQAILFADGARLDMPETPSS